MLKAKISTSFTTLRLKHPMYFRLQCILVSFTCLLAGCVDHKWTDQSGCENNVRSYVSVKSGGSNPSVSAKFYKNEISYSSTYNTELGTVGINSKGQTFAEWDTGTSPIKAAVRTYGKSHFAARVEAKAGDLSAGVEYSRDCSCAPDEESYSPTLATSGLWSHDTKQSDYSIESEDSNALKVPLESEESKLRRAAERILDGSPIYSRESFDSRREAVVKIYQDSSTPMPNDIRERINDLQPLKHHLRRLSARELSTPVHSVDEFQNIVMRIENRYQQNGLSFPDDIQATIDEKEPLAAGCKAKAELELAKTIKSTSAWKSRNNRIKNYYRNRGIDISREVLTRMSDRSEIADYLQNWADEVLKKGEDSKIATALLRRSKLVRQRYKRNKMPIPEPIESRMIDMDV